MTCGRSRIWRTRHGALFYTDAVQALGMFPADVRAAGVDCMTSGTYKWLLGGFGVAPFFIRRELLEPIRVDRLGALHVEKELGDHRYEIYRTAKKFEYATLPFAEVYQLGAALDLPRARRRRPDRASHRGTGRRAA